MKVLFNRDGEGRASSELKECLSFLDVDISYKQIKFDVFTATRELIKLIGEDIYNIAYQDYSTKTDNQKDLVDYMRYAISLNAYRMYAPNNDIAHTSNGRKMRQDEFEKQAFEWMIDRDNESLERKYYRSLDDLLHYLEESVPEWKTSEANKKLQESIFKTTDEFDEHFYIGSRLLLMKLQPGIKQCLSYEIKPKIGSDRLDSLLKSVDPESEELLYMVQQACAYSALAWAMPRLSVQMFPDGIIQSYISDRTTTQSKQVAPGNALAFAKENFEKDFNKAIVKIETILAAGQEYNPDDYIDDSFTGSNFIST